MTQQELDLLKRYHDGLCTDEEIRMVEAWYTDWNIQDHTKLTANELNRAEQQMRTVVFRDIPVKQIKLWPRIAAACVVLIGISCFTYIAMRKSKSSAVIAKVDFAPFTQQAVLKTGHGKKIVLQSSRQVTLAKYNNAHIQQNSADQIAYTNNATANDNVVMDTLEVPPGGKPYHLILSDGSSVILNVASSIRFPENFRNNRNSNELELLSGEAYFTIIHNSAFPLTVKAKTQTIEDIGTEFNVNTYNDEPVSRTTLISGAARVNHQMLKPGQQAVINSNHLAIEPANLIQITAWKDGIFRFKGVHIDVIMRELARWYNIDVRYEGKVTDELFYARVRRDRNISEVLKMLEKTQKVHFKIDGRRVTVLSK